MFVLVTGAHNPRMHFLRRTTLLFGTCLLFACGDDSEDPTERGFTECGQATCQPGQFCEDSRLAQCSNGCTSDLNCAANQTCQDPDFFNVGVCRSNGQPSGPECGNGTCEQGETTGSCPADCKPTRDATCDGYADHAKECGLLASAAEALRQECSQLDAETQRALVACNASETCGELLGCSGVECFEDGQCPRERPDCIYPAEVVDPFTEAPFTCR